MIETVANVLKHGAFNIVPPDTTGSAVHHLMLRSLDPSHTCYIWVTYPVHVAPAADKPLNFKVNVKLLQKALKMCGEDGVLELGLTEEHLEVRCTTAGKRLSTLCDLLPVGDAAMGPTKSQTWRYWLCMPVDDLKSFVGRTRDLECTRVGLRLYPDEMHIVLMNGHEVKSTVRHRTSNMQMVESGKSVSYQIGADQSTGSWDERPRSKPLLELTYNEDMINRILKSMSKVSVELRIGRSEGEEEPPLAIIHTIGQGIGADAAVVKFLLAPQAPGDDDEDDDHMDDDMTDEDEDDDDEAAAGV